MKKNKPILQRRFVSGDEAQPMPTQHRKPCADCPFARTALKGWLGSTTTEEWVAAVAGEARIDCHCTTNQQCAGAAIFRANLIKVCKVPDRLSLPPDKGLVFETVAEFQNHHTI